MYDEDHATRLVMLARTMATEQNAKTSPLAQVAINGFAWVDHGMGYSFVESPPTEALHPMPMRRATRSPPPPEPQAPRASGCALNGARPSPRRRARDPSGGVEAACDRLSVPLGHRAHRRRGSAAAASPPRSSERRPLLGSSRATVHVVDRRKPAVEGAIVLRPESTFPAIEALPAERLGLLR
jgi:hypothetical protein